MAKPRHRRTNPRGTTTRFIAVVVLGVLAVIGIRTFFQITVVHGTSMNPTYVTGDLLVSMKTNDYKIGDVVTYHPDGLNCDLCHVVHRIITGNPTHGWITQGDNNPNRDGWLVHDNEIGGKVILHIHMPVFAQIFYLPQFWLFFALACLAAYLFLNYWEISEEDAAEKNATPEKQPVLAR